MSPLVLAFLAIGKGNAAPMDSLQSRIRKQALLDHVDLDGQKLSLQIFALLEHQSGLQDTVSRIEHMLGVFSGCEAVAVSLPGSDGTPCFDDRGTAEPLCICAQMLRGESHSGVPHFSSAGSFWINESAALKSSSLVSRVTCPVLNSVPCESMAIVPLICGSHVIGVIQLGDKERGLFSPTKIHTLETVANAVGIVLARMRTEEDLGGSVKDLEARFQERTEELFAAHRLLRNELEQRTSLEQNLSVSQHRLELATHAANLGSWDWDVSSGEVLFDRLWSSFDGYTGEEGESVFRTWNNLIHPDDKLRVLRALKNHLDSPFEHFEAEYRLKAKTGEWRWILDRGKVVEKDPDGKPLRMAGVYVDITDRKRIEEELHEKRRAFSEHL